MRISDVMVWSSELYGERALLEHLGLTSSTVEPRLLRMYSNAVRKIDQYVNREYVDADGADLAFVWADGTSHPLPSPVVTAVFEMVRTLRLLEPLPPSSHLASRGTGALSESYRPGREVIETAMRSVMTWLTDEKENPLWGQP